MLPLSVSVVVYRTGASEIEPLLRTFAESDLASWTIVDNSAAEDAVSGLKLRLLVEKLHGIYLPAPRNIGFGAGHNLAVNAASGTPAEFHLMCNPDIVYKPDILKSLVQVMNERPDVGLIMPKVQYSDGSFQPVCKLLPDPLDFALRRFAPSFVKRLFIGKLNRYEMEGIENIQCDRVPFLSGCFLFARRSVLQKVSGFDERFFLYLEDVDLCRRLAQHSRLLYWPGTSVVHICYRGAYRNRGLMWLFLRSAFAYFQKWGWCFDSDRRRANRAALACLRNDNLKKISSQL